MNDSEMVTRLKRACVQAEPRFVPVFEHAIAAARESDYIAHQSQNMAMTGCDSAYPPMVELLADTATEATS